MPRTRNRGIALLLAAALLVGLQGCGGKGKTRKVHTAGERVAVLDFENRVAAEAELKDLTVVLPAPAVNDSWTQTQGSASGAMGHLALGETLHKAWSTSVGEGSNERRWLNAVPVILANRLFAMDTAGAITAFDATTGRRLWRSVIVVKKEGADPVFGGGLALGTGRVYATTGLGVVAAYDAADGRRLWQRELPTPLRGGPAIDEGRLFVTSLDGQLTALSAETGETLWQATSTLEPATVMGPGSPAVALGTVVAGFPSGELFALRVENGRTAWQDQLARTGRTTALGALSAITAAPIVDRGRVFAVGNGGRMASLDLPTGQRVWERAFAGVSPPWSAGDWLFAVTLDAEVVAMTRLDGKVRWVRQLERFRNAKKKTGFVGWHGPVLAGGRLILVSSAREMVEIAPATGEVLRRTRLDKPAYLPPVVANNMLYVLTADGTLTAWR